MRLARLPIALLAASSLVSAQTQTSPSSPYNENGDPWTHGSGFPAPGDVWSSITHAYGQTDGVAPFHNGNLLVARYGDGLASVFEIDPATGAQVADYPVEVDGDGWLGYDSTRNLIITCDALADTLKGFTPGNGVPVFTLASPVPGPVGVAYDPSRDEYAVCDWDLDQLWIVDATTLTTARTLALPLTRMAGVAYDCIDDVYIIGDRDTNLHSAVDPVTGAISLQYMTAGSLVSDPRGAALSNDGGIWTGDFTSSSMYEQEAGHAPMAVDCLGGGGLGTNYCVSNVNSTGSPAVISATGSSSITTNDFTLEAGPVPSQPGLFYYGPNQIQLAFGNGFRCVGGFVVRLGIVNPTGGTAQQSVDLVAQNFAPGAVNFQYWFRDPAGGGSFFDLSDGLEVTFTP